MVTRRTQNLNVARLLLPLLVALAALACLPRRAAAVDATLSVSDGNPQFSAREINPGQSTAADFLATPYAGHYVGENGTPSITSESFEVTVDSQTTITSIGVGWPGAIVTPGRNSTPTDETFTITGSVPTATFQLSIVVAASSTAATGDHPVTLTPTAIVTSDGDGTPGSADTEDFDVEVLAVNVDGPPNVILDNGPGSILPGPQYFPPPIVESTYTAVATGGSGNYSWAWAEGAGISLAGISQDPNASDNYNTSNPVVVYGTGPTGPSTMTCVAYDATTTTSQPGVRHVYVLDEFVKDVVLADQITYGPASGITPSGSYSFSPPGGTVSFTQGESYSISETVGLSISGTSEVDAFTSNALDTSMSVTTVQQSSQSVTMDQPVSAGTYEVEARAVYYTTYGVTVQNGPETIVSTTPWANNVLDSSATPNFLVVLVGPYVAP